MVLEIPAYDSYYEVGGASENVAGPRNRESPDVESPPPLRGALSPASSPPRSSLFYQMQFP